MSLPKLIDKKQLAAELDVRESVAETIMQRLPKRRIGKRVFVDRADVAAYLDSVRVTADGFAA